MSDVIYLISQVRWQDAKGIWQTQEVARQVYTQVNSVTRSEWYAAGKLGLNAAFRFDIRLADYGGQESLEYKGERYGVYRTYNRYDHVELYAERKVGL